MTARTESRFADRRAAGRVLARRLSAYADRDDVVVLALPRGGVPVAREVAAGLRAPLDALVARKVGAPGHAELAIGAVAIGGVKVANERVLAELGLSASELDDAARAAEALVREQAASWRGNTSPPDVDGKTVIVVDDGLATGATMRAALTALRAMRPAAIVAAVPVGSPEACASIREVADDVVCAVMPADLWAVGQFYDDFGQIDDEEVRSALAVGPFPRAADAGRSPSLVVAAGGADLDADLEVPSRATGVVVFVHGLGSNRHSPRNAAVAAQLRDHGLATVMVDLYTPDERARAGDDRMFDAALLGGRVAAVVDTVRADPTTAGLPVGLFGASTGAAAVVCAAADRPTAVSAVVSRGGRLDLAGEALGRFRAPALLIVGEDDAPVVEINRRALALLRGEYRLEVVQGAGHLFEEPGAMAAVTRLSVEWFGQWLTGGTSGG